ncbi:hypothetical protein HMN09_01417000 [Mycena chlorophos]|uniref:Uncharacterized protein n=1 Tax=Mycena chlorophos TaxID=658473 RepID=A0A8H6VQE5_MYCCL|nr:hypothetical protein HMN09_01417000 [Mycena chlorophos]
MLLQGICIWINHAQLDMKFKLSSKENWSLNLLKLVQILFHIDISECLPLTYVFITGNKFYLDNLAPCKISGSGSEFVYILPVSSPTLLEQLPRIFAEPIGAATILMAGMVPGDTIPPIEAISSANEVFHLQAEDHTAINEWALADPFHSLWFTQASHSSAESSDILYENPNTEPKSQGSLSKPLLDILQVSFFGSFWSFWQKKGSPVSSKLKTEKAPSEEAISEPSPLAVMDNVNAADEAADEAGHHHDPTPSAPSNSAAPLPTMSVEVLPDSPVLSLTSVEVLPDGPSPVSPTVSVEVLPVQHDPSPLLPSAHSRQLEPTTTTKRFPSGPVIAPAEDFAVPVTSLYHESLGRKPTTTKRTQRREPSPYQHFPETQSQVSPQGAHISKTADFESQINQLQDRLLFSQDTSQDTQHTFVVPIGKSQKR